MPRLSLAVPLFVALLAGPAGAASYTSAWFFGDSLSDPGNLYAETGTPQSPPYFEGRFSNGPVWAEHIADDFTAHGLATGNFAFGGATAADTPGAAHDLAEQISTFSSSGASLGRRPVAAMWIGSNDILDTIGSTPTAEAVGAAAVNAAVAVGQGISSLVGQGVRNVVVFNLAPLQLTPQFALIAPQAAPLAQFGADTFNAALAGIVAGMGDAARVKTVDIHLALTDLVANPEKYGVSDVVNPCIYGNSVCSPEQALQRAFFDPVHPNSIVHGDIADLVRPDIAPVPLPASVLMMLVSVAGLAAAGWRGRARF